MKIYITGASGFVGKNLILFLSSFKKHSIHTEKIRLDDFNCKISHDIIIHLAGKAHDLKNTSDSEEYYKVNTELTKKVFDVFLLSTASTFIFLSSVKAMADEVEGFLTEEIVPNPKTAYGRSKLLAENYILNQIMPENKKVFILRPCMIHGSGNKGNLNLLFKIINKKFPWPLGAYQNQRSFCSIENLCFIIKELIERGDIPSGVYNIADDGSISTNDLIKLIANSQNIKPFILFLPKKFINFVAKIGDILKLPLNSERLQKLTESYLVSNDKIKEAIGKSLPLTLKDGLMKTFKSVYSNV